MTMVDVKGCPEIGTKLPRMFTISPSGIVSSEKIKIENAQLTNAGVCEYPVVAQSDRTALIAQIEPHGQVLFAKLTCSVRDGN
jgi:hypothetical protein